MIAQNSEVYNPPTYLFSLYTYTEKDLCRGVVYFTVLCDHPCFVSLLFAVLVSLHPVTFSNVFYYLYTVLCSDLAISGEQSVNGMSQSANRLVYTVGAVLTLQDHCNLDTYVVNPGTTK